MTPGEFFGDSAQGVRVFAAVHDALVDFGDAEIKWKVRSLSGVGAPLRTYRCRDVLNAPQADVVRLSAMDREVASSRFQGGRAAFAADLAASHRDGDVADVDWEVHSWIWEAYDSGACQQIELPSAGV